MNLYRIQQSVFAAQQILAGSGSNGQDIARILSDVFHQTRIRLGLIANLMERGESSQAQYLAEQSPRLEDVVRILGFEKLMEWNHLCVREGWPQSNGLDQRHLVTLQDCFQVKGLPAKGFSDHIRGRILRGDRGEAIMALRVFLRQYPNEAWAKGELARLLVSEAVARVEEMHRSMASGQDEKLAASLEVFQKLGLEAPPGTDLSSITQKVESFRREKLVRDLPKILEKIENWKASGSWSEACECGDYLRAEAGELGVKLPSRASTLLLWADGCRSDHERKVGADRAEKSLTEFLDNFEKARDSRIPLRSEEVEKGLINLNQFQRNSEELRHRWTDLLEIRRVRVEKILRRAERGLILRKRIVLLSLLGVVMGALLCGGYLAYGRLHETKEAKDIAKLLDQARIERSIAPIENYLHGMGKARPGDSVTTQIHRANLQAVLDRAQAQRLEVERKILELEKQIKMEGRSWTNEAEQFHELGRKIRDLAQEHGMEMEARKARLEKIWLEQARAERTRLTRESEEEIALIQKELQGLVLSHDVATERLKVFLHRVKERQSGMGSVPLEIRPSEAVLASLPDLRLNIERKLEVAKELQGLSQDLHEASRQGDEKKYMAVLERLAAQPEISHAEKTSMKKILLWMEKIRSWKTRIWYPRNKSSPAEEGELRLTLDSTEPVLPGEKDKASEISEIAGLAKPIYKYRIPGVVFRNTPRDVFMDGKIGDTYTKPNGELVSRVCRIWDEGKGDFTRTTTTCVSLDSTPPTPQPEPVNELYQTSKMKDLFEGLASGDGRQKISLVSVASCILTNGTAPDSGKIFLLQKIQQLYSSNPEAYDVRFLPWLEELLKKAGDGPELPENIWLSTESPAKYSETWQGLKALYRAEAEKEGIFLRTIAGEGSKTDFIFVAMVGNGGLFPETSGNQDWYALPLWKEPGEGFLSQKRDGLEPLTPVYRLSKDPARIVLDARVKSGLDQVLAEKLVKEYLPVLKECLYPNR